MVSLPNHEVAYQRDVDLRHRIAANAGTPQLGYPQRIRRRLHPDILGGVEPVVQVPTTVQLGVSVDIVVRQRHGSAGLDGADPTNLPAADDVRGYPMTEKAF